MFVVVDTVVELAVTMDVDVDVDVDDVVGNSARPFLNSRRPLGNSGRVFWSTRKPTSSSERPVWAPGAPAGRPSCRSTKCTFPLVSATFRSPSVVFLANGDDFLRGSIFERP